MIRRPMLPSLTRTRPTRSPLRITPRAMGGLEQVSYYVGKSIVLFTMFYCGLNWLHYRDLRKKREEDNE